MNLNKQNITKISMNVLFLTLGQLYDLKSSDIYSDLMECFLQHGHQVYIVTPYERSMGKGTECYEVDGAHFLAVKTLNIQKTSIIEKGLGTISIGWLYKRAIKKYLGDVKIDLVTYSTPPITLASVVRYVKKKYGAKSYLQLKDIFPQNAVDIGMIKEGSLIYRFFRKKEKELYAISDYIGCMSPANVKYVLEHNPEIKKERVEICPNAIALRSHPVVNRGDIRMKYGLPIDKPIFLYGGNLGKPQGINFFVECLKSVKNRTDCHFLIVGSGTDANKVDEFIAQEKPTNISKISFLPKEDYYRVVASCDIGLIFLDHRFTIPNFPSRLLPYLEYKMPVICASDVNTDIKDVIVDNKIGYWCESKDTVNFDVCVNKMLNTDYKAMGERGYEYLKAHYQVEQAYNAIIESVGE